MKILAAYVPVLHRGYLEFFQKNNDADILLVFGSEIIQLFDWLYRKEIRAVDPETMRRVLSSLAIFPKVGILDLKIAEEIRDSGAKVVFADEEESRAVAEKMFRGCNVSFDRVFLRWDKKRITDGEFVEAFPVTSHEVHRLFMAEAAAVSERSSDWWRQVGAVLVSGDKKIVAYNSHIPSEHTPYALGDPRNLLKKGIGIEVTSVLHSEAAVVIRALREGVPMEEARLYVTTFPCPYCSIILAHSGITELYFSSGYSVLDGASLLTNAGIKIFRVV